VAAGEPRAERSSFRDPDSTVFYAGEGVFRALSARGLADWERLAATPLLPALVADGRLVETELVDGAELPPALRGADHAAVLRHEVVPFVSYPYEWTAGMLRDAALLQLDLVLAALDEDLILKDASPYNVQWRGARPVFVDVGSFEPLREGEPWAGYRQFCMLFLYPLMLHAYRGVPFQPWLRGSIDGIAPAEMRALMSGRGRLRRGVMTHVHLHARLDARYGERGRTSGEVRGELRAAGFGKELIRANVSRLQKLVERLDRPPPASVWTEYGAANTYSEADAEQKRAFVRNVVAGEDPGLVWDLGCNDGAYSRIAADAGAGYVVAVEGDRGTAELLYRALRDEGEQRILPLTMNLADPSPSLGWRGAERRALADRGRPGLVLCLALLHHLSIGANVPVGELVDWLRSLGAALVVEFVAREDPMVERLLAAKREGLHSDYELDFFERCLSEAFEVERRESLSSGTRTLYLARPRG
jgi:hypothetical protein